MENNENRFSVDFYKRLLVVSGKIFKKRDETKIIDNLVKVGKKQKISDTLEFIYLLIADTSDFSNNFWNAFVISMGEFNSLPDIIDPEKVFSIKSDEISGLLKLVEKNHKEKGSDESGQLLDSFKRFITTNALLRGPFISFDRTFARFNEKEVAVENDASAIICIEEEYKKLIVNFYKQILLNSVFLIHGITTKIISSPSAEVEKQKPSKKTLRHLIKSKLLRELSDIENLFLGNLLPMEKKPDENGQERAGFDIEKAKILAKFNQSADIQLTALTKLCNLIDNFPKKQPDEMGVDTFKTNNTRWMRSSNPTPEEQEEKYVYRELTPQKVVDKHFDMLLQTPLEQFTTDSYAREKLNEKSRSDNIEITLPSPLPNQIGQLIADAFNKFLSIVEARVNLESCYLMELVVPEKSAAFKEPEGEEGAFTIRSIITDGKYDPEATVLAAEKDQAEYIMHTKIILSLEEVALIAGINNLKTVKNEAVKKDSPLEYAKDNKFHFLADTVKPWLKETKRKYRFYDVMSSADMPDETITIDSLRKIHEN